MRYILLLFFLITSILSINCKNDKATKTENDSIKTEMIDTNSLSDTIEPTNIQSKEFTSKYICPMHCKGSGSDTPGTCPVCGMEYIENPDNQNIK